MGWFKKYRMSERERLLREEIEQLESEIKTVATQLEKGKIRVRSTAVPSPPASVKPVPPPATVTPPREPTFEEGDSRRLQASPQESAKALYNADLGLRKYDLPGAWRRLTGQMKETPTSHQTFVRLLSVGNIQGMPSLRHEKNVARRRFLLMFAILFLVLWGVIAMLMKW